MRGCWVNVALYGCKWAATWEETELHPPCVVAIRLPEEPASSGSDTDKHLLLEASKSGDMETIRVRWHPTHLTQHNPTPPHSTGPHPTPLYPTKPHLTRPIPPQRPGLTNPQNIATAFNLLCTIYSNWDSVLLLYTIALHGFSTTYFHSDDKLRPPKGWRGEAQGYQG